ncbi:S41 family peptidase [Luteimonas saliphila]|uniref:S41 family peptidase n=1 Tax=Luteimonas saliphila TaxID=2804919 RepID=UPI00192D75D6|nr:S41 family peptidase [Luteimonas saliphila]
MDRTRLLVAALGAATLLPLTVSAEPDWPERLRDDATAFHAAVQASHPGPVDPGNPQFAAHLDAGLDRALARADEVTDFAGYWWAMREFQAGFDDGHVQLSSNDGAPELPTRWPGFLTRWSGTGHVVATRLDAPDLPPVGARLVACDGIAADAMAVDRIGRVRGRWHLEAQRVSHGGRLFLDAGDPWAQPPTHCSFAYDGREHDVALAWRTLDADTLSTHFAATRALHGTTTGVRAPRPGQLWIAAASFDADDDALTALLRALDDATRVGEARHVVLDLRGNGGGSSHWSREIARRLWGDAALAALPPTESRVDWRVDAANLEAIREFGGMLRAQPEPDAELLHWVEVIDRGMSEALARGDELWRHPADAEKPDTPVDMRPRALAADAPVYVLADAGCASACLDALDLWLPLGAIHVGGETSADTVYMDIRQQPLPSGLATASIPMKVYRGRSRGHNEPYRPSHVWTGDFADESALSAWIASLAGPAAEASTR